MPNFIPVEQVDCDRIAAFRSVIHENQAASMKSRDMESEPLHVGQYIGIQKREKPFIWSEVGQVSSVTDHGKSYYLTPIDGGPDKLRNGRYLKPKEPASYNLSGTLGRSSSLEDVRVENREAPAARSNSLEELSNRIRSSDRLKDFTKIIEVPWNQGPAGNTRSKVK